MTEILSLRPLAAVLVSAVAIGPILATGRRPNLRESWTGVAALAKFAVVASMVPGVLAGDSYVTDLGTFLPAGGETGIRFALEVDSLGLLFGLLASGLWVVTSCYSVGYMRGLDEGSQTRYFAAFAGSLSAAMGVAFASNLVVLFVFYELLTVATYPLVAHDETDEARAAGRKYLAYTFGGGVAVLGGTALVYWLTGSVAFTPGGIAGLSAADPALARLAFALLIAGFGVKAALMPLHSWLPDAMVAPTPVSALLHAVAVVKSGVFGIARVVLDTFGPETVADLGAGLPLAAVAAFTLLTASVIALRQDNLKRRLAFSTVSQLSYIVLGLAVLDPTALVGGLLHIPAHAFMKITLFFCAGAIHVETHTDDVSEMAGIGRRMPLTMAAFAVAAAGMAGIPLVAGFVSKYFLLIGSVSTGGTVFALALLVSGVLNIAYFWPVVYTAFFESPGEDDPKPIVEAPLGGRWGEVLSGPVGGSEATGGTPAADGSGVVDAEPSDGVGGPDEHDAHEDHDVHEGHGARGAHADGWERRGWTGGESTWFMLGPILVVAAGSIVLGVVPDGFVFLRVVRLVVAGVTGVSVP
ncbi:cation:proton antiporter [Halorarum salinum]|uniref:Cation:proton antiporter n=1 Tax=Halorarum salinum TaxID=2743089 RepID=A0A7D5LBX9_9EURY|nr:cation:proton antiporter [Halobaculum salinum]QLG62914.1 cation:proton antiporter [Halobaculum salinum]